MDKDTRYWMIEAMDNFGGGFVASLALCYRKADENNTARLDAAFPELVEHYTDMGMMLKNRQGSEE